MICEISGKEAKHCTPTSSMYNRGCRCEGARKAASDYGRRWTAANREHVRDLKRRWVAENPGKVRAQRLRHLESAAATCPICGRLTESRSGFCRGCEARR